MGIRNRKNFFLFLFFSLTSMLLSSGVGSVDQMNEHLVSTQLNKIEGSLGQLPTEVIPQHFLVNRESFYRQAPKILNLIDFLVKNKHVSICQECLDEINDIVYLQCHKFICDFPDDQFEKNETNFSERDRLLDVLCAIYSFGKKSHKEPSLETLLMTKVIICGFLAKTNKRWGQNERHSFLSKALCAEKSNFCSVVEKSWSNFNADDGISFNDIDWGVGRLQTIFTKDMPSSVIAPAVQTLKTIAKYALYAALIGGGLYVGYRLARSDDKEPEVKAEVKEIVEMVPPQVVLPIEPKEEKKIDFGKLKEVVFQKVEELNAHFTDEKIEKMKEQVVPPVQKMCNEKIKPWVDKVVDHWYLRYPAKALLKGIQFVGVDNVVAGAKKVKKVYDGANEWCHDPGEMEITDDGIPTFGFFGDLKLFIFGSGEPKEKQD